MQDHYWILNHVNPQVHSVLTWFIVILPQFKTDAKGMKFEIFITVKSHTAVYWIRTPCRVIWPYQCFGGADKLHLQGIATTKIEATCSSKTLVTNYQNEAVSQPRALDIKIHLVNSWKNYNVELCHMRLIF
jgi:hypothetical protein